MFTLEQVRAFSVVARELHFRRAAERLNMTQPPLSRQIQSLERTLGAQLLVRGPRGVSLTPAGDAFLPQCERILALVDASLIDVQKSSAGVSGTVHLGFTSVIGHSHLPALLKSVKVHLPELELQLHEGVTHEQLALLENGTLDLVMGRPPFDMPGIEHFSLPDEHLLLAVSPLSSLARREEIRLVELEGRDFIMFNREGSQYFHDLLVGAFALHRVTPHVVQRVTQVNTMLGLVQAGVGAALVPESARGWSSPNVAYVRLVEEDQLPISASAVWNRNSPNAALGRVAGLLTDLYTESE